MVELSALSSLGNLPAVIYIRFRSTMAETRLSSQVNHRFGLNCVGTSHKPGMPIQNGEVGLLKRLCLGIDPKMQN